LKNVQAGYKQMLLGVIIIPTTSDNA